MPVEIRELVIRAVVNSNESKPVQKLKKESAEKIVSDCVEQVMQRLKEQEER